MHCNLARVPHLSQTLFQSQEFSLGMSFTLLSENHVLALAHRLSIPPNVAEDLAHRINIRAATAFARPIDLSWRGGLSGQSMGADILLLGMPIAVLCFPTPPSHVSTWLQTQSVLVTAEEDANHMEEYPLSHFLEHILLSDKGEAWVQKQYTRWATNEMEVFLDLHPATRLGATSTDAMQSAIMITHALAMLLPYKTAVSQLARLLINDCDVSELALFLKGTGALGTFAHLLTSNPVRAGKVWKKRPENQPGLLPILLMTGCRGNRSLEPRELLRSVGIGNRLARRLSHLPLQMATQVCEAALSFAQKDFAIAFFRNLAKVFGTHGEQWRTGTLSGPKLEMLLKLTNRLALLDILEQRGWSLLSVYDVVAFSIAANTSPYQEPQQFGISDYDRGAMRVPLHDVRTVLTKAIPSIIKANDLEDLANLVVSHHKSN